MRWLEFDMLHPQTTREWVIAILCFWPIAPIWILLHYFAERKP